MAREVLVTFWTLLLLLSVTALSAAPTSEDSDVEEVTLSTELKPPPAEKKEYLLFVLNLFNVKNITGETSEEIFENDIIQNIPELRDSITTVLLIIELDNEGKEIDSVVDLNEVADTLKKKQGLNVEKVNYGGKTNALRLKLGKQSIEALTSSEMGFSNVKNIRSKRSICVTCSSGGGGPKGGCGPGGCGGGGGYPGGGGGYPGGGGGYPGGGGGGGGGGGYPGGGGGGYPGGGGGGYPGGGGGYPGGGGGYPGGGGGYPGGGGGYPGGGGGYPGGGSPGSGHGGCSTCGGGGQSYASAQSKAVAYGGK